MLAVRDVQITVEVGAADAAQDASRPVQTHVVPDAPQAQGDRGEVDIYGMFKLFFWLPGWMRYLLLSKLFRNSIR